MDGDGWRVAGGWCLDSLATAGGGGMVIPAGGGDGDEMGQQRAVNGRAGGAGGREWMDGAEWAAAGNGWCQVGMDKMVQMGKYGWVMDG